MKQIKRRKLQWLSLVSAILLIATPLSAKAQVEKYTFDKAHTQILFFVDHLGFSMSQGEFHDYSGHFIFNRDEPEKSSVEVTIKTDSIDMDHEKWNEHMKNEDFFNVKEFPVMIFRSKNIEVTGQDTANIHGDLTLLGITRPVTLEITHNKSGEHPFNKKYVAGFSADATIKRSDWNMNYGLPLIGDEVQIILEVEGFREDQPADDADVETKDAEE